MGTGKAFYLQDQRIAQFLSVHFVKQNKLPAGVPVGFQRLMGNFISPLRQSKDQEFVTQLLAFQFSPNTDYYLTANSFCDTTSRSAARLFSLHNIVIDIDAHGNLDPFHCTCLSRNLRDSLHVVLADHLFIPEPNSIVCTGRGIQLWWSLNPITLKSSDVYDRLVSYYIREISSFLRDHSQYEYFRVDVAASTNKAGLFRMPGTYNTKAGLQADVMVYSTELYSAFDLKKKLPRESRSKHKVKNLSADDDSSESSTEFARGRANVILNLAAMRQYDLLGMRDLFLWLYYNELIKCENKDDARADASALNAKLRHPFTETELENKLAYTDNVVNYIDGGAGYAITTQYIIDNLGITEEECIALGLISPHVEPAAASSRLTGREAVREKQRRKKARRYRKVIATFKRGETQIEIAARFHLSRGTVSKVLAPTGLIARMKHVRKLLSRAKVVIASKKKNSFPLFSFSEGKQPNVRLKLFPPILWRWEHCPNSS